MKLLSSKQLRVMEVLWEADGSMRLAAICERADMCGGTAMKTLCKLQRKGYVEEKLVQDTSTRMYKVYCPVIRKEAYLKFCLQQLTKLTDPPLMIKMVHEIVGGDEN